MERVRPLDGTSGSPRRRSGVVAGVAAIAAAIAAGILLSGGVTPETIPPNADERALASVRAFESALAADLEDIDGTVAADWLAFEMPGLELVVPWRSDRDGLADALGFYAGVAAVDLGPCRAEDPRTGERAAAVVQCPGVRVGGVVMDAIGVTDTPLDVSLSVGDDGVVALLASTRPPNATMDYCIWAEAELPALAEGAFDRSCNLDVRSDPRAHVEMATAFVAAGRPSHDPAAAGARLATNAVAAFEARLAAADRPAAPFDRDWITIRFPGLLPDELAPPFPTLSEFLSWSAVVYDVELGGCEPPQRYTDRTLLVACPGATWGGPLPTTLGLTSVQQPVSFLVTGDEISGVFGESVPTLTAAFEELCRSLQAAAPTRTAEVLSEGCVPKYSEQAGRLLLALAAEPGRSPIEPEPTSEG